MSGSGIPSAPWRRWRERADDELAIVFFYAVSLIVTATLRGREMTGGDFFFPAVALALAGGLAARLGRRLADERWARAVFAAVALAAMTVGVAVGVGGPL